MDSNLINNAVVQVAAWFGLLVGVVTTILYVIGLLRVHKHETEIEFLHDKLYMHDKLTSDEELIRLSLKGDQEGYDQHYKFLQDSYKYKIERKERQRRFILEKLPFMKK